MRGRERRGRRIFVPTAYRMRAFLGLAPFVPGYPFHSDEPIFPVFIVGSGRSGTTLMRRVLLESGQLHIPGEMYVLGNVIPRFRALSSLPWDLLVHLVLADFEYSREFEQFGVSLRPLAGRLIHIPPAERSLASLIDAVYRYTVEETDPGTTRWGDKTPTNTYHLRLIHSVFPRARYLHLVRDGCDVVASMISMGRYASLEEAAERWRSATASARRFSARHPEACLEVRYEDLVTDTENVVKRVCSFVDIQFDPKMIQSTEIISQATDVTSMAHLRRVLEPISPSQIGIGRRTLDIVELTRLQDMIGTDLARLGYRPCV